MYLCPIENTTPLLFNSATLSMIPCTSGAAVIIRTPASEPPISQSSLYARFPGPYNTSTLANPSGASFRKGGAWAPLFADARKGPSACHPSRLAEFDDEYGFNKERIRG